MYLITFKEENAYDPVISQVSRDYPHTNLSIIAGNIEYIQQKPLGRLLISLRGDNETERQAVLEFLKTKAFVHEFKVEA